MADYGRIRSRRRQYDDLHELNSDTFTCQDTNHGRSRPFASECHIVKESHRNQQGPHADLYYGNIYGYSENNPAYNHSVVKQSVPASVTSLIADARSSLFQQTFDDVQKSDVGVFLATLGETIRMVKDPFSVLSAFHKYAAYTKLPLNGSLKQVYREGMLRFNPRKLHSLPTQVTSLLANLHLQKAYGWDPLLSDLEDFGSKAQQAAQGYSPAKLSVKQPMRMEGKSKHQKWESSVVVDYDNWVPYSVRLGSTGYASGEAQASVKAIMTINPPAFAYDPYEKLRKGLNVVGEAARIGWELTPYSFVVDWFIPVGGFLSRVGERPAFVLQGTEGGASPILLVITRTKSRNETKYAGLSSSSSGCNTRINNGVFTKYSETAVYDRSISNTDLSVLDVPKSTGLSFVRDEHAVSLIANVLLKNYR